LLQGVPGHARATHHGVRGSAAEPAAVRYRPDSGVLGVGCWVLGFGFGVWDLGLGFGVRGLGFGVRGSGFGVRGLGFGV